ncbi:MAG: hypothetical protein L0323_20090 [Planctomycetes bacterium]|nr:hypothetical protein [Planctomycetota bacterium]
MKGLRRPQMAISVRPIRPLGSVSRRFSSAPRASRWKAIAAEVSRTQR